MNRYDIYAIHDGVQLTLYRGALGTPDMLRAAARTEADEWRRGGRGGAAGGVRLDQGGAVMPTVHERMIQERMAESYRDANAALIAAAPDYYAAAEAIRSYVVAAERLDDGQECSIPADLVRALLDAHRRAYAPWPLNIRSYRFGSGSRRARHA